MGWIVWPFLFLEINALVVVRYVETRRWREQNFWLDERQIQDGLFYCVE